jgi:hypothetical protein
MAQLSALEPPKATDQACGIADSESQANAARLAQEQACRRRLKTHPPPPIES